MAISQEWMDDHKMARALNFSEVKVFIDLLNYYIEVHPLFDQSKVNIKEHKTEDHICIPGMGLELACNGGSNGGKSLKRDT